MKKKVITICIILTLVITGLTVNNVLASYGDEYNSTTGVMVVVSSKSDNQLMMYFDYDVNNPTRIVGNQLFSGDIRIINDLSKVNVGYYKPKKISTSPYEDRNWYISELHLTPIEAIDLPHSQHIARLKAINPSLAKPATVTRRFNGVNFDINCFVSQTVVELYQLGKISIGDYVIVSFIDETPNATEFNVAIVVDKVYESW